MERIFWEAVEENPIIAAVKNMEDLEKCCSLSDIHVVFILFGDVCSIDRIVKRVKDAGKVAMVHVDLISGLSPKEVSVEYLKEHTEADGIISTKPSLIKKAKEKGVNLVLAVDAKIADDFSNDAKTDFAPVDQIPDGWEGLDIGPKTEAIYADVIKNSKTILWNGPTGVFEFENFTHGSRTVGEAIVEATKNGAFSLVGGGDSVACVNKFGLANGVSYVSTGGGALLEAIEGKVLPGIAAVKGEAYK